MLTPLTQPSYSPSRDRAGGRGVRSKSGKLRQNLAKLGHLSLDSKPQFVLNWTMCGAKIIDALGRGCRREMALPFPVCLLGYSMLNWRSHQAHHQEVAGGRFVVENQCAALPLTTPPFDTPGSMLDGQPSTEPPMNCKP